LYPKLLQAPVNEAAFTETIVRVSHLCRAAPEIVELDLNPLLAAGDKVVAVDARIRITTIQPDAYEGSVITN
jgi:acetyltransferase